MRVDAGPVASLTASSSATNSAAVAKSPANAAAWPLRVVRDGKRLERPRVAGELNRTLADLERAVVIP